MGSFRRKSAVVARKSLSDFKLCGPRVLSSLPFLSQLFWALLDLVLLHFKSLFNNPILTMTETKLNSRHAEEMRQKIDHSLTSDFTVHDLLLNLQQSPLHSKIEFGQNECNLTRVLFALLSAKRPLVAVGLVSSLL